MRLQEFRLEPTLDNAPEDMQRVHIHRDPWIWLPAGLVRRLPYLVMRYGIPQSAIGFLTPHGATAAPRSRS